MKLPAYREDGSLNVVVESPRGSAVKYKYDPREQVMTLSRPLPAGLRYPHDWGFVAGTHAPDGDPLDAMVVWDTATHPGIVIPRRAIGVLRVEQTNLESRQRERNDRVLVLPLKAPRQEHVESAFELPERVLDELAQFFLAAVAFEGKELSILGWGGPDEAKEAVREASKAFDRENRRSPD